MHFISRLSFFYVKCNAYSIQPKQSNKITPSFHQHTPSLSNTIVYITFPPIFFCVRTHNFVCLEKIPRLKEDITMLLHRH